MKLETFHYTVETGWSVKAFPRLDSPSTLVIAFGAPEIIDNEVPVRELREAYPNSCLVGCSSAGEIFGVEIFDGSLVVAVVQFERATVAGAYRHIGASAESQSIGTALARELYRPGLRAVLVLSDGTNVQGSELVRGLNAALPESVIVTGGLAGDGDRFRRTWVIRDGRPQTRSISAVGFYGESLLIGYGSKGGWDIFGPERIVTRSEGNILYELDGTPALALYKQYLGHRAAQLPAAALLFPLALRADTAAEKRLVRTILSVDEDRQSMTFAGDIPQGYLAQLMTANFDRLLEGAANAAWMAVDRVQEDAQNLCIAISCVGRRLLLGDRAEEETEAILEIMPPQTRQIGFYSYGEIAPFAEGFCDLHNQTMTLTTITEARADRHTPVLRPKLKEESAHANFMLKRKLKKELSGPIHPLLRRQLKKAGLTNPMQPPAPELWARLLNNFSHYYAETEEERYRLERSLNLCSEEMQQLYRSLAEKVEQLNAKNEELARKNRELERSRDQLTRSHERVETIFAAFSEILPGTILDNKYQLEKKLGAGGLGVVFQARHLGLDRPVAVKIFRPNANNANRRNLDRFMMEGVSSCRVNHPNAIIVYDACTSENGMFYLVMELLVGNTLGAELAQKGKLSVERAASIIVPACKALAAAHASGIVHRDVKPDNIFLHNTDEGEIVKVVDFGIAKLLGNTGSVDRQDLTIPGNYVGTPAYMAPERFEDTSYDGLTDVYSLGVILYQMLAGRLPFEGNSPYELAYAHLMTKPKPLRQLDASIPEALETLVMSTLSKQRSARPTAKDLAREIATIAGFSPQTTLSTSFRPLNRESGDHVESGQDMRPGAIVGGKYTVENVIGQGSMGKVFRVSHLQLNKPFALKLMNFNTDTLEPSYANAQLARFKREASALAKINHPNIVAVTDFGLLQGTTPFIVMEYIEGITLRQMLKNYGSLAEARAVHIAKQMCAGLHAAHALGIVHRDLKPENIMIQPLADGELLVRILDFGIAKDLKGEENLTIEGQLLGTLKYMTAEQLAGITVDERSDVYSICLILYEMLTGQVPKVSAYMRPPSQLRPGLSPRLDAVVLKGLTPAPEARQQSALELRNDLEHL